MIMSLPSSHTTLLWLGNPYTGTCRSWLAVSMDECLIFLIHDGAFLPVDSLNKKAFLDDDEPVFSHLFLCCPHVTNFGPFNRFFYLSVLICFTVCPLVIYTLGGRKEWSEYVWVWTTEEKVCGIVMTYSLLNSRLLWKSKLSHVWVIVTSKH
jgi:hypothetical protein